MSTINIEEMAKASVQVGHKTQRWNPRMRKFIYGEKNGIHIFNLEETKKMAEKAMEFLNDAVKSGKRVMIVSTKPQSTRFVIEFAKKTGTLYVVKKWVPGLLTNFETMKKRIRHLTELKRMRDEGEFDKYTKKEIAGFRKEIEKLEASLGGVEGMDKLPEVVLVLDSVRDKIAVDECRVKGIPTVGICDTNADPFSVDHPIPGNDDSVKSIEFFLNLLSSAFARKA
jgi:small subunit ribosomal protein S2